MGFDFKGTFTNIKPNKIVEYSLDAERKVTIIFLETEEGVKIVEAFEAEDELSADQQRQGWQSILDNFKKHVEAIGN